MWEEEEENGMNGWNLSFSTAERERERQREGSHLSDEKSLEKKIWKDGERRNPSTLPLSPDFLSACRLPLPSDEGRRGRGKLVNYTRRKEAPAKRGVVVCTVV